MTVQAWLLFSSGEAAAAAALSTALFRLQPREINNPMADNLGEGPLVGMSAAPAKLLNDPDFAPIWGSQLAGLPVRVLDSEVLFLPPVAD